MAVNLSPLGPLPQFEDSTGAPMSGGLLFFYAAGSSTKQNTYTDSTGTVANPNPIQLDAYGSPPNGIWLTAGSAYKIVLAPATDTDPPSSPIYTRDNIYGINDVTVSQDQWVSGPAPTYVNATQFTLTGDQTSTFHVGRRLRLVNAGGTLYGYISASAYAVLTTITVVLDSGTLDAGLSSVSYGLVSYVNTSVPFQDYGTKAAIQSQTYTAYTTAGTAPNYTITPSPALTSYTAKQRFSVTFNADGTPGSNTLNVSGIGERNIYPSWLPVFDGATYDLQYDGTQFVALDAPNLVSGLALANGKIVASVNSNALTVAIKTIAGNDPSPSDPVFIVSRNATIETGDFAVLPVVSASSLVVSSGSTLGTSNNVAFKVWVVGFNDAGTFRLGVINCLSGTSIYPLGQSPIASSTAEGGAGAADNAQTFYTEVAVSAKPYQVLGYFTYESGLATAGTWASTPTRIQLYGVGTPLPGFRVQEQVSLDGAVATGTTVLPNDDTVPQNTEGNQFQSVTITPTSAANVLDISAQLCLANSGTTPTITAALFQDSTANALAAAAQKTSAGYNLVLSLRYRMLAGTSSATTLKTRAGGSAAGTTTFNGSAGAREYGGVANSALVVAEIVG